MSIGLVDGEVWWVRRIVVASRKKVADSGTPTSHYVPGSGKTSMRSVILSVHPFNPALGP